MSNTRLPSSIMQAKRKMRGALLYAFLRNKQALPALDYMNRHAIDILKKAPDADYVIDQLTTKERSLTQVAHDLTRAAPVITTCDKNHVVWLNGKACATLEMSGTNLLCSLKRPAEYRVAQAVFQEAESRKCDVVTRDEGGDLYNRIGRIIRTLDGAMILSDDVDITTSRLLTLFPADHFASITSNSKVMIRHQDNAVRCRPFTDADWTTRRIVADTLSLDNVDIAINDLSVRSLRLSDSTLKTKQLSPQKLRGWRSSILCLDRPPALRPTWKLNDCTIRQEGVPEAKTAGNTKPVFGLFPPA